MNNVVYWLDIYIFLAIGYNVASQLMSDCRGRALAPTDPTTGVLIMVALYLWFRVGPSLSLTLFGFVAVVFIYLVCRFGIYRHIVNYSKEEYSSRLSWGSAISINIFGVCILLANVAYYLIFRDI